MQNRRQHYRHGVSSLAYVRLDQANGGVIRDLSESGMAVQAVACLVAGQVVQLRFELMKPRVRIEASGMVAWADATGQAGLCFLDLSPGVRQVVKEWVFTELLAAASELAPIRAPIFGLGEDQYDGLVFSAAPISAIRLAEPKPPRAAPELEPYGEAGDAPVHLWWWPAAFSQRIFARLVDSMIVIAAVLLFAVIAVETAGVFPTWKVALGFAALATFLFGRVYGYLCAILTGMTVGRRLARLAANDLRSSRKPPEEAPRFR
jgi:PilZ domain-containing protein/RDD family protein